MPSRPPRSTRARPGPGRKVLKRIKERQVREQRELATDLQDRAARQSIPARDDGPPPRID